MKYVRENLAKAITPNELYEGFKTKITMFWADAFSIFLLLYLPAFF